MENTNTQKTGGWLTNDHIQIDNWVKNLKLSAKEKDFSILPVIQEFKDMVDSDIVLYETMEKMFAEAYILKKNTPLEWQPEPVSFEEFIILLNAIMYTAPQAYQTGYGSSLQPAGMIGFPINALLVWPMATSYGYSVFSNALVNQQFKKILTEWSKFLVSPESRYVLHDNDPSHVALAWLSPGAQKEMVGVAYSSLGPEPNPVSSNDEFSDIFECDPSQPYYGFKSWDDFFTRKFNPGIRPVSEPDNDNVIVNACESAPLGVARDVKLSDQFWLKGMPYSLENMMNWDEYTSQFVGGTVYQAFLSALSFHRWHSPVNGTIVKTEIVNGTYYLENSGQGFSNPNGADPVAPNNSQAFLTAVATRALIYIQADNPNIGLMCVMPVGMAEVSSCEITVQSGDRVNKGDELGMFHFGGSTHCLFFRPGVNLNFETYGETPGIGAENNIRVNCKIATVVS